MTKKRSIVERLRGPESVEELSEAQKEGASEIERLRAAIDSAHKSLHEGDEDTAFRILIAVRGTPEPYDARAHQARYP